MRIVDEFNVLLDEALADVANSEPTRDLQERLMRRVADEAVKTRAVAAAHLFDEELRQEAIFHSLWMGLRDALFPERLPELVLESRPVPVVDRMAVRGGYGSRVGAAALHGAAILLVAMMVRAQVHFAAPVKMEQMVELAAPPKLDAIGGGGGHKGTTPVTKGTPPKFTDHQIVAPKAPPMLPPKIVMEPMVEVEKDVKMASSLPQIGVANSPLLGMSMGDGSGTGLGSGNGSGIGPGFGGNIGGGLKRVGGAVSAPVVLFKVDPEFSEEARKAKASGVVLVNLWVDPQGNPSHVRVLKGVGMGLDEKAVAAVKQYRFKPAMEDGRPVTVEMNVEVTFDIF